MTTQSAPRARPSLPTALAESLVVVVVWGSSFVLVKAGLRYAGPLTLAGLRYTAAFLILLPFALRRNTRPRSRRVWVRLALIGLCAYTIGNGCLFWGLQYLPSTTSSFLMSLVPLLVLAMSIPWLREYPTWLQIAGLVICLIGCAIFFAPGLQAGEPLGLAVTGAGLVAFAAFGILGREVARDGTAGTLALTAFPLGFGGIALLPLAFAMEGLPRMAAPGIGIVLWLALANTALAYLLYNHALQTLTALEMNLLLNLSPFATAIIALLALGERLRGMQYVGMVVAIVGVALAQWRRNARPAPPDGA
ncbi:MAG: EamA family transporter [Anaerolineae bacterium]|nr:EamA family transporter [Anaerolineae bacterium]